MLPPKRLLTLLSATLLALLGTALWLSTPFGRSPVQAAPVPTTRYVSTTGNDTSNNCSDILNPCRTPQRAVDMSLGNEEIWVAAGVYTGVQARYGMTQVVYNDIDADLLGGYNSDFSARDPSLYPTILDAQGQGRVVSIVDTRGLARLDGFTITGGDAEDITLHCPTTNGTSKGCGGGIFVYTSTVEITNNIISGNVAATPGLGKFASGGGLCLSNAPASLISGNQFVNNTASLGWSGVGGGMHLVFSDDVVVEDNQILSNTANNSANAGYGGGIAIQGAGFTIPDTIPNTTIQGNLIQGNRTNSGASGLGAGIFTYYVTGAITGNQMVGNIGAQAVILSNHTPGRFEANRVIDNNTDIGVYVVNGNSGSLTLANNIIANSGDRSVTFNADYGAPLTTNLIHNTLVGNGSGYGVYIEDEFVTLHITNTIVTSFTLGITNTEPAFSSLNASHTLFWGNQDNGITGVSPVYGNPRFVDPSGGDYHLLPGSAAIDFGIMTAITTDIDGDLRPFSFAPDIGADESDSSNLKTYLPLLLLNY